VFDSPKAAEDAPTEAAAHGPSKTPEQMAAMLEALKSSKVPPKSELFEVSFFSLSTSSQQALLCRGWLEWLHHPRL